MRNSKKIEMLEIQINYLVQYLNVLTQTIQELLEKEDQRAEEAKNIDSGKWYKNS